MNIFLMFQFHKVRLKAEYVRNVIYRDLRFNSIRYD